MGAVMFYTIVGFAIVASLTGLGWLAYTIGHEIDALDANGDPRDNDTFED